MWECAGGCSFLRLGLVGLYFAVYICSQVMLRVRCSLAVDGIRVSCMFFNLLFCPFICLLLSISLCRFCILCFHFGVFVDFPVSLLYSVFSFWCFCRAFAFLFGFAG